MLLLFEFGIYLAELFEVRNVTPRGGLSCTLLPWFSGVWGRCQGVGLSRLAKLVPFIMLLMPFMEALSNQS